jgi:hypothetical protein
VIEGDIEERMAGFAPSQRTGPSDLAREIMSQQVAGPSMEPTVPEPSPLAREIMSRDNDSLMSSLMGAVDVNPDEAAKASRIGSQLGVGQDIALRNMPEMEHRARMMQLRQMQLQQRDPILAEFMSDQAFARMAYDDLPNLSVIGRAFRFLRDIPTGISEGFTKAVSQAEMSQILERQRERGGYLEEYEKAALRSYQQELSELSKETGLAEAGAYLVSQQLTDWRIEDVERVVTGGVIGGGAGFVGGPLAPATVPVGIALGLKAGAATTMFERSRRMETAMLYGELEPELGHDMANKIAFGAGILNASLDVGSLGLITAPLRAPLKAAFGQAVKEAVRKRTVRDSFARFGLWYAGSVAAETGTETLQEMNNVLAMELGLYLQEKPLVLSTPEGRAEVADRLAATAVETALGMVTVGLPGPAVQFYSDVRGAARAMNEHKKLENITKAVSESKLLPRNSAALESYIASTAEGSDASTVFIDAATTNDILRQSGLTDVELDAALPGVRQQIETLQEKDIPLGGSDITIPMEQFTVRIAKTPLQEQLKQHARLSAGAPSFLEAQRIRAEMAQTRAEAEQILATKQEADAAFVAEAQQVEDEAFEQVRAVGQFTDIEARTIAKLRQAMVVVDAAEAGMTPAQYQRERGVPLQVRGVQGEVAPAAQLEQAARIDTDYTAAVERGDTATAQRMVNDAAIASGYSPKKYYHASSNFRLSDISNKVFYVAETEADARKAADAIYRGGTPIKIYEVYIPEDTAIVDTDKQTSFLNRAANLEDYADLQAIRGQMAGGDIAEIAIINPTGKIKSADPVTRDEQGNIVPLSRRFDITSPKLFEQAAAVSAGANAPGVGVAEENKMGFWPRLRVKITPNAALPVKPLILTGTTNKNAAKQLENIDGILQQFPDAGQSPEAWAQMLAYAFGSDDVPVPPYAFIQDTNGDGSFERLSTLTEGQIADATHGFDNAREFRRAYTNNELDVVTTGKLFLWSFLSRGVSPYTQESLFIDAFNGADEWIRKAAQGQFTENDLEAYEKWAKSVAPKGSGQPGAGATHNLNAFGQNFLLKMGAIGPDGRSNLQRLHDMMCDPNQTGKQIRREFATFGEGVGIDNKVVSFTLLVAGFNDVMVLDRVQVRQLWDDGRFSDTNLYDGVTDENNKKIAGSSLNAITEGARGILIYEAIERQLASKIDAMYTRLGRPQDASIGRYHWETWVAYSQQEAAHATLDAILLDAKGDDQAISKVSGKQGEYGAYEYGTQYNRDKDGNPWFRYTTPLGGTYDFSVPVFRQFLTEIKKSANKVVPTNFKVTESGNAPWYTRPEVNQQRLEEQAAKWADRGGGTGEGKRLADEAAANADAIRARSAAGEQPAGRAGILEQAAAGPARGGFDPRTLNVLVGKGGDVSTLAHELIHLRVAEYLRMARGTTPPARVNADLETLFDFMGVEGATFQERLDNYETMTIDQRRPLEEKVTYNFEIYLYEGKAPSVELRGVFDRLAAWMRRVYKSIRDNLNEIYRREFGTDLPILTPEVRSVFDRMLASEEQIKRQEAIEGMKGLFQTQAESGMDNAEWAAYQAMQQEATEAAVTDLNTASMRQVQWLGNARARILRDLQKKHDAKRKEVTAEVAAAVKVEPVYRAMTYLRYGRFVDTDGAEVEVEGTHRLDIEKVRAMYAGLPSAEGVELIRATGMAVPANVRPDITPLGTGKYGMLGRDGLDPDVVAEMFGYGSGDEMVRALLAAKPMKDAVAERTDAEMLRRYGDMNTPAALEAEVQKALHNEARARFVAVELRHIAKATQPVRVMLETAKQVAADMISDTTIRDLRPGEFVSAEARAARDAERIQRTYGITEPAPELAQRYGTDRQQALIRAKRAQLYQNQLAAEALRVKEYVDKQVKYLRGVMRDSNVKRMGAAAADQVAGLLERFEVAPVSLKRLDERRTMAKYLADLKDAGVEPDIADEITNEARRVNYKQLKVSEFRDLVDAVKQIEHIGKNEQKMRLAEERAAFEEVRDDVVTRIRAVGKVRELQIEPRSPLTGIGRSVAFLRGFAAQHLKAASIARILDGGKEDGPLWNAIIRTANDASDMETRMRAEASLKLGEILKPVFALGGMGGKGMYFPAIGRSLNREARIAIALNLGNDGNRQRLLDGEGWTLEQLQPVLESLTEAEWLAVQKVWDFIDGYRPEIAAKERRLYGKEPEWVKPTPFTVRTSDGKEVALQGGYYPVKYDPVASDRVATVDAVEEAKRELKGAYTAATTRRSFVKTRAKEVHDKPILYTLDAAFSGVNDVIHDLSWHEWLISTNRLLNDSKFANAVRETRGWEFLKQLRDWTKDNATGARGQQVAGEAVLSWLRQGISASGLGFNVVSAAMQITGFNQSIVRIGAKYVGQGIMQFSTSPFESAKTVAEKSSFMAERGRTQFREINEIKNRVRGQTEVARRVTAGTYFLMMNMQRSVDIPTWLGAYQKALDAGKDDAKAVALADQAVRDSQGSGLVSDLAAMERGGPAMKLFTVFYSYMNTVYNMTAVQTMTARGKGKLAADYAMLLVVPVVLGYAIKSVIQPDAGDDELDPEALARKLAAEELSYLMGTMVIAREFGGAAQLLTGAEGVRMGYGGPAGLRAVGEVYGLATQAGQLEFDRAFRRAAINTLGAFTGLPSAQINRTIDGIEALVEGEVEGPTAVLAPLTGVQR